MNPKTEFLKKILYLLNDIVLLAFKTFKQIVLSAKCKRWTVLSGFFDFFVNTFERISKFEHGFFLMSDVFKTKYVKQALSIIAVFLFLASSFERSGKKIYSYNSQNQIVQLTQSQIFFNKVVAKNVLIENKEKIVFNNSENALCKCSLSYCEQNFTPSVKIYLFINSICI